MNYRELFDHFKQNRNVDRAVQMSAYMRNQFSFLGIPSPKRKELSEEFLKEVKKKKMMDWGLVQACWKKEEREFQYVAIDYLKQMQHFLTANDIPKLKKLALDKSWWGTIDALDKIIGNIALKFSQVTEKILRWSEDDNRWLRRIAINHQNGRKENTDAALLEKVILNNFGQTDFFINKAIGWSLREYSKVNRDWVDIFLKKYEAELALLSIR